jgi:hypothetical protein
MVNINDWTYGMLSRVAGPGKKISMSRYIAAVIENHFLALGHAPEKKEKKKKKERK